MQPSLFSAVRWSVSALTRHIRETLESDAPLQDVWVQGEVSNLSRPASGHVYFTLKDAASSLRCVIWKSSVSRLAVLPFDGAEVAVHGRIGVYEAAGQYQLYADQVRPVGEGELYQEFMRLKQALEAEGLFAPERKRPLPTLPRRIGLVTSPTGAAIRDVLDTIQRRLPMAEVVLAASQVQGAEAPAQVMAALQSLNGIRPAPDVILLVRGGGSIEDLWAFNDEGVVRAVAASNAPVVCGVGHETDFTLSDFAADVRAPTPTAAAELATPITRAELSEIVRGIKTDLGAKLLQHLSEQRNAVRSAASELRVFSPVRRIQSDRQRLDEFLRRVQMAQLHRLALQTGTLAGWSKRLDALSPTDVLARGYAIVTRKSDGVLVRKVAEARGGIHVRVSDGGFEAEVRIDPI